MTNQRPSRTATGGPTLLDAVVGGPAWRWAAYAVAVLPSSLAVSVRAATGPPADAVTRVSRRATQRTGRAGVAGPVTRGRALGLGLLGVPVGLWAWALALLLVPNTLRNLAYPLTNPTPADYGPAWGGPTLLGAWVVHAGLALLLVPLYLALLHGLGVLHVRLVARVDATRPTRWEPVVVAVLAVALVVLGRAWWHQV